MNSYWTNSSSPKHSKMYMLAGVHRGTICCQRFVAVYLLAVLVFVMLPSCRAVPGAVPCRGKGSGGGGDAWCAAPKAGTEPRCLLLLGAAWGRAGSCTAGAASACPARALSAPFWHGASWQDCLHPGALWMESSRHCSSELPCRVAYLLHPYLPC